MDWRIKALGHWLISASPRSDSVGYLMQRRVTKTLPMADELFIGHVEAADRHLRAARKYLGRDVRTAYEFGAGWDLVVPLALARAGVPSQTLTDIRPLVRPELVADAAARLGMPSDLRSLGITYLAPLDAMSTGLAAGSFDLVTSTDTLEHVPERQLVRLLAECRRLLTPDGIFSARIDYRDHFSYGDPKVGPFQFLRYGQGAWGLWNPPTHYQSRLRHPDHLEAIRAAGFDIVDIEHPEPIISALGPIHPMFARHDRSDLAIPEAWIVARPAPPSAVDSGALGRHSGD